MLMYTHTHLNESRIALIKQNFDALDRATRTEEIEEGLRHCTLGVEVID